VNFAGFAACAALLAYALYTSCTWGWIRARCVSSSGIGIALLGVVFLAAALHHPPGRGAWGYALLLGAVALATLAVAARHVYVQSLPPGSCPSCGAPLAVLLKFTPLWQVIARYSPGVGSAARSTAVPRPRHRRRGC